MIRALFKDKRGSAAIIFSVALVPMVAMIGAATELGGISADKTRLQSAADSAALGAAGQIASMASSSSIQQQASGAVASFVPNATISEFHMCTSTSADCSTSDRGTLSPGQVYTKAQYVRPLVFGGFLRLVGGSTTTTITATSVAMQAFSATQATFTPLGAKGWYFKVISLWVHRPGASTDTRLASYVYQPQYLYQNGTVNLPNGTTVSDGGKGTTTSYDANGNIVPSGTAVSLGSYDNAYLIEQVSFSPCPPGQSNLNSKDPVSCGANGKAGAAYVPPTSGSPPTVSTGTSCSSTSTASHNSNAFDLITSTADAATACFLYIGGKQLTPNVKPSVFTILPCSGSGSNSAGIYAWEDGGGWATQDFFFTVSTSCQSGAGGNAAAISRLTN